MNRKQSVLLGLRDKLEKTFGGMLDDFVKKFENKQGIFKGWNKTFVAEDGYADVPEKRSFQKVSSTVPDQMAWFKKYTADYFDVVLSIEKTNSTGIKAKLVVDRQDWGEYSVLELLRLKSIMDGKLKVIVHGMPIRDEKQHWIPTTNQDLYAGKDVYETPVSSGFTKTTLKRTEIVQDPHIKDAPTRPPVAVGIETQVNTGKFTEQSFSGEITELERAKYTVRLDKVYVGVIEALETANNMEAATSDLGSKFLNYLIP